MVVECMAGKSTAEGGVEVIASPAAFRKTSTGSGISYRFSPERRKGHESVTPTSTTAEAIKIFLVRLTS
jgi:hypothetical protein